MNARRSQTNGWNLFIIQVYGTNETSAHHERRSEEWTLISAQEDNALMFYLEND